MLCKMFPSLFTDHYHFFLFPVFRAVAQYLKKQSPITPISENSSEDLSLNKLLKGKTRKLCARLFFETLVII